MKRPWPWVVGGVLLSVPFIGTPQYYLHILIMILIWAFIYTSWSLMGRFRLTSLGHGAFMCSPNRYESSSERPWLDWTPRYMP